MPALPANGMDSAKLIFRQLFFSGFALSGLSIGSWILSIDQLLLLRKISNLYFNFSGSSFSFKGFEIELLELLYPSSGISYKVFILTFKV